MTNRASQVSGKPHFAALHQVKSIEKLGSEDLRKRASMQEWRNLIEELILVAVLVFFGFFIDEINGLGCAIIVSFLAFSALYDCNGERSRAYESNKKNLSTVSQFEHKCINEVMRKYPEFRDARVRMGNDYTLRVEADFVANYDRDREDHLRYIKRQLEI